MRNGTRCLMVWAGLAGCVQDVDGDVRDASAPGAPDAAPPDASAAADASAPDTGPEPERALFHLGSEASGTPDAISLGLGAADAVWVIFGCDYCGGDRARRTDEDGRIVLRAATDGEGLRWFHGGGFAFRLDRAELTSDDAGLTVRGYPADGSAPFEQRWSRGGLCATCDPTGEILGPTGLVPCDEPPMPDCVRG